MLTLVLAVFAAAWQPDVTCPSVYIDAGVFRWSVSAPTCSYWAVGPESRECCASLNRTLTGAAVYHQYLPGNGGQMKGPWMLTMTWDTSWGPTGGSTTVTYVDTQGSWQQTYYHGGPPPLYAAPPVLAANNLPDPASCCDDDVYLIGTSNRACHSWDVDWSQACVPGTSTYQTLRGAYTLTDANESCVCGD